MTMPNTKEKGKLIEVLSKHIPYGYATLCLIADELMADGVRLEEKRATSDGCITKAVMEKLVELLITSDDYENSVCLGYPCKVCQYKGEDCTYKARADHLIAHGVTVQECCHKAESVISQTGLMCTDCHSDIDRDAVFCKYCGAKVMPQPPKEND